MQDSRAELWVLGAAATRPVGTSSVPKTGDLGFLDATEEFRTQFSLLGPIPVSPV